MLYERSDALAVFHLNGYLRPDTSAAFSLDRDTIGALRLHPCSGLGHGDVNDSLHKRRGGDSKLLRCPSPPRTHLEVFGVAVELPTAIPVARRRLRPGVGKL